MARPDPHERIDSIGTVVGYRPGDGYIYSDGSTDYSRMRERQEAEAAKPQSSSGGLGFWVFWLSPLFVIGVLLWMAEKFLFAPAREGNWFASVVTNLLFIGVFLGLLAALVWAIFAVIRWGLNLLAQAWAATVVTLKFVGKWGWVGILLLALISYLKPDPPDSTSNTANVSQDAPKQKSPKRPVVNPTR